MKTTKTRKASATNEAVISILGKTAKVLNSDWSIVKNTTMYLDDNMLDNVVIEVHQSDYSDSKGKPKKYAKITLNDTHQVEFTLDINVKCEVGDYLDPYSFKVYQKKNISSGKIITRAWGEVLDDED